MALTDRLSGAEASRAVKAPCYVASTGNLTLSSSQTIDGILAFSGARVLVKDQTDATENGIYLVDSSSWTRAKDFDKARDVMPGTLCYVDRGTLYGGSYWVLNSSATSTSISIGTASLTFSRVNNIMAGASTLGSSLVTLETGAEVRAAVGAVGSAYLRVFSTSATWSKPTGLIGALVEVVGGGAGGGAAIGITGGSGGGGGAGGYSRRYITSSDLSGTETVIVGTGGAGGTTSTGATSGSVGSSSQFGSFNYALGGVQGGGSTTVLSGNGGLGGQSSGGSVNGFGSPGLTGSSVANTAGNGQGGNGGNSFFSGGGRGSFGGTGSSGHLGSGGGGGNSTGAGGAGGNGVVVVTEFTATST